MMQRFLSPLNLAANQTADHTYAEHTNMCTSHTHTHAGVAKRCITGGGPSGGAALRVTRSHKPTNALTHTYTHNGDNEKILKERVEEMRTVDRNYAICQGSVTIATPHYPPPPSIFAWMEGKMKN